MGTGSFSGVKRPGRGVEHQPYLAPRLKEEYNNTSTPPLGLRGLFYGDVYLYFYFTLPAAMVRRGSANVAPRTLNLSTGVLRGYSRFPAVVTQSTEPPVGTEWAPVLVWRL